MSTDKKESLTKALENTIDILKSQGMGANANAVQAVIGLYQGFLAPAAMFDNDLKETAPWTGEPDSEGIHGSQPNPMQLGTWYQENMQRLHEEPGFLDLSKQDNTSPDNNRPMFVEELLDNHDPDVKMTVEGMIHSERGVELDNILPDRALLRTVAQVVAAVTETVDDYHEADATQAIVFSVLYDYLSKKVQAEYAVEGAAQDMLKTCEDFANRFSHQQGLTSDTAVYVTIEHGESGLPTALLVSCNRPDIVYALDLSQFRFKYAEVYFVLSTLINDRLYLKDHLLALEVEHAVKAVTSQTTAQ